jgi:hypothetical protein
VTDEQVLQLNLVFSEDLLLAALDIIDRNSGTFFVLLGFQTLANTSTVLKHTTAWGGAHYEVFGSTTSYTVHPHLAVPANSKAPNAYCSCPTFTHTTLLAKEPQLMVRSSFKHVDNRPTLRDSQCKHLLATRIAIQLQRCVDRAMSDDDLAKLVSHA